MWRHRVATRVGLWAGAGAGLLVVVTLSWFATRALGATDALAETQVELVGNFIVQQVRPAVGLGDEELAGEALEQLASALPNLRGISLEARGTDGPALRMEWGSLRAGSAHRRPILGPDDVTVIGELVYVVDESMQAGLESDLTRSGIIAALVSVVFALGLIGVLTRRALAPLNVLHDAVHALSEGDLTSRLAVDRDDEIGQLSRGFNEALDALESMVHSAHQTARSVADSATKLIEFSEHMTSSAATTGEASAAVAHAAKGVRTVIAAAAETAARFGTLTDSVVERSGEATDVVRRAVEHASATDERLERLRASGGHVGEVIGLIGDIAGQTKSWRSTRASRRPARVRRAAASRWSLKRSRPSRARPRRRPAR